VYTSSTSTYQISTKYQKRFFPIISTAIKKETSKKFSFHTFKHIDIHLKDKGERSISNLLDKRKKPRNSRVNIISKLWMPSSLHYNVHIPPPLKCIFTNQIQNSMNQHANYYKVQNFIWKSVFFSFSTRRINSFEENYWSNSHFQELN